MNLSRTLYGRTLTLGREGKPSRHCVSARNTAAPNQEDPEMSTETEAETGTTQMNIETFIKRHGITFSCVEAPDNPHWTGAKQDGTAHWYYTLKVGGREMSGHYSKSSGLRRWRQSSWNGYKRPAGWKKGERASMPWNPSRCDREAFMAWTEPEPPTASEVLDCLAMDASGVESTGSFESWAEDLGMDTDSRSAEASYRATVAQTDKLRKLLGSMDFRVLIENVERL